MPDETHIAICSKCGAKASRDDMFGIEPELLCEKCATGVRERTRPVAAGRMASAFGGKPTPVTAFLLGLTAAIFVAQYILYKNNREVFPQWLWLLLPAGPTGHVLAGDWWRLITSALIHGGWLHVIFNCLWIWSLGRGVESTRGSARFLLIFLGSAAFASAAQLYLGKGVGIGLSGVLYALAGYLWMRRKEDGVAATVMNPNTSRMLGMWFVICWVLPMGIANWAHAGGLVWGLAAGWISTQEKPGIYAGYAILAAWTIAASWYVTTGHVMGH